MIVADLDPLALSRRLRTGGLRLRTGPVVSCIRSCLEEVERGMVLHYSNYPIEDDEGFVDFHIRVDLQSGLRRWIRPQVVFEFDGTQPFAPLPPDQGFAMLEWGLNWCVASHCHQYLVLHAAVLERDGRALLLPAPSGSGKSTLCAALAFRGGWRLLSDELALLDLVTGNVAAMPRPVSLKNMSIDTMRPFAPDAEFGAEVHETLKGRVTYVTPPANAVIAADRPARPAWVVAPRYVADAPTQLEGTTRARGFMALVENAFNYEVHGRRGFMALASAVDRCQSFNFTYSDLSEAVDAFEQLARARQ